MEQKLFKLKNKLALWEKVRKMHIDFIGMYMNDSNEDIGKALDILQEMEKFLEDEIIQVAKEIVNENTD